MMSTLRQHGDLVARAAIVISGGAFATDPVTAVVRAAADVATATTTLLARATVVRALGARSDGVAGVTEARAAACRSKQTVATVNRILRA